MSDKATDRVKATSTGAESPTTARELDFDDDNDVPPTPAKDEAAPAKPPRPMSPEAQAEATLIEAFPSVDSKVVKAVLTASGGQLEPAFNALLSMSDPNYKEETAPPQPPRPTAAQRQLEQDELYARQLAEQYQHAAREHPVPRDGPDPRARAPYQRRDREGNLQTDEYDDRERNFFDDDLPEIKENIRKGFLETQKTVNSWITNFKKTIDGEDDDELGRPGSANQRQNFGPSQSDQFRGIREHAQRTRQSGDLNRYDADPQILSDDFTTLKMQDNEAPPQQPPRPGRPLANPDLFKPTPVAPQTGPVDEVEALYRQPTPTRQPSPGTGKAKKWQPLTSVAPNPEADDHDPFSLGDSDDEDTKTKDVKAEDTERLQKAAAESTGPTGGKPEAAERSGSMGTQNKEAVDLLTKETKS